VTVEAWEEGDGFLGSFCSFVQHGLLIFNDIQSTNTHSGWDGKEAVHAEIDSIYLRVQPSVVGSVSVDVFSDEVDEFPAADVVLFDGVIHSAWGEFILHDPNDWISMKIVTDQPGPTRLLITGDRGLMPSIVRIQVRTSGE
jgi:hypothetical protein